MKKIKNIAIIAHVDHGKTTLMDAILRQTGTFRSNQQVIERIMDSNDLEREKGITIFSKNASFYFDDYKINVVDTPGHADFGGEVQRILRMVDSVLLLVDAFEGPMPQTKYVLKNSLQLGHNPIVVINKVDRNNARPKEVVNMVFDLFIELNANEAQLDFPIIYASAKEGFAVKELKNLTSSDRNLIPLFETIISHVKDSTGDEKLPFQFLTSAIEYDNYLGRMGTGKIHQGHVSPGDMVALLKRDERQVIYKVTRVFSYEGLRKSEEKKMSAGDIVTLAGLEEIDIGDTVTHPDHPVRLDSIAIDEPTLSMTFRVNDSPFMGQEGKYVTSRNIWERLQRELLTNVSMQIEKTEEKDSFTVKGRGELQLAILIENMRREGYEFQVSRPKVIYHYIDGKRHEPIEMAIIDVSDEHVGSVIEMIGKRKGEMINMVQGSDGYTRLEFKVPARGLIGFRNEFLTETRGTGILNQSFLAYEEYRGDIPGRSRGVLVSMEDGNAVPYALDNLQDRGAFFIRPGVAVYEGMIVGEHTRENDIAVNVCKTKKLTNIRASGSDDAVRLTPPREFSLEQALEYIQDDELLEVTPNSLRLRKKLLKALDRKRADRSA